MQEDKEVEEEQGATSQLALEVLDGFSTSL
jgi:hypothetical protein